jgi:hypothetical protein
MYLTTACSYLQYRRLNILKEALSEPELSRREKSRKNTPPFSTASARGTEEQRWNRAGMSPEPVWRRSLGTGRQGWIILQENLFVEEVYTGTAANSKFWESCE